MLKLLTLLLLLLLLVVVVVVTMLPISSAVNASACVTSATTRPYIHIIYSTSTGRAHPWTPLHGAERSATRC